MSIELAPTAAGRPAPEPTAMPGRRRFGALRYLMRRDPVACLLVAVFVLVALLAPVIEPYSPTSVDVLARLEGPSSTHLLGTDQFGRDLLSRIIAATRIAAEAAVIVLAVGALIGAPLGAAAGVMGRLLDAVLSRLVEVIQGFPVVLLAIVFVAVTGRSLFYAMLAVGIGSIPDFYRIARGVALQLRSREFVEAARGYGASWPRIIRTEIMPNTVGPLMVVASFDAATAVMYESALSFIGLGAQPPTASFGRMLFEAKGYLAQDALYAVFVGVGLAAVILGLNLLGDALSDYYERDER
jgi:peptide/nickel transport system permease protein